MVRNERHNLILQIIAEEEIDTQEGLCEALRKRGYSVTQATVSRDIRNIGLYKVPGTTKKTKYSFTTKQETELSAKSKNLFKECVLDIKSVGNLLLIKTLSGNASNAGVVIDQLALKEIAGTIAGDDTLLIVCENANQSQQLCISLKNLLKSI